MEKRKTDLKKRNGEIKMKKLFKFALYGIGVLLVIGAIMAVASEGEEQQTQKSMPVNEEKEQSKEEPKKEESLTKENFDKIQQGDALTGEGGMTEKEVIAILGKPESEMETQVDETKMKTFTWLTSDFESITVSFTNGHVSSKMWVK